MQVILNYLKENDKFTTALIISLAVCALGCVAVWLIRKFRFKKLNQSQNGEQSENLNIQEISQEENQESTKNHQTDTQNLNETAQNDTAFEK